MEGNRWKYRPSSVTHITQTQLTSECEDRRTKKVDLLAKHFSCIDLDGEVETMGDPIGGKPFWQPE